MAEALLDISDLHVVYETDEATVHAVNGLDLQLQKGETLGLVGETGAGKTTVALSVLRLLPEKTGFIRRGSIKMEGLDLLKLTEADMKALRGESISMIFQDPMTSLNPILTVGDQIAEVYELHRPDMTKAMISERVDQILQLVGISPTRKNEYPHQFSGGMKQRVVIAIALACEPKILIADEPTTALDVTIQAQVLDLMRDLQDRMAMGMILITHDLGVVAQNCDRVAIMYAGEIVEIGSARDIFKGKDHHPYTVGLFGSVPQLASNARRLSPVEGLMPDPTALPSGCKFHPRCPKCMEICRSVPPTHWVMGDHTIRCHLYSEDGR